MRSHRSQCLYALLTLFIIQCSPSRDDSSSKIVGGTEDYNTYPAAVGLSFDLGNYTSGCTGTVVRDDLVMTAAHCVTPPTGMVILRATAYAKFSDIKAAGVSSSHFIVHPNYDPQAFQMGKKAAHFASDIAFIKFAKGALKGFVTAQIAPSSPAVGDPVTIVGYGSTQLGSSNSDPSYKRHVGQNQIAGIDPSLSDVIILTNSSGKAVTNSGDSGGPLFNRNGAVIGVISSGTSSSDIKSSKKSNYVNLKHPSVAEFVRQQLASAHNETSSLKSLPNQTSLPGNSQNNGTTYPYCSSQASDPDADGWSFENSNFCKMPDVSKRSIASANNIPSNPANVAPPSTPSRDVGRWYDSFNGKSFPYCASNASDPDADGWGYENGQSCKAGYL